MGSLVRRLVAIVALSLLLVAGGASAPDPVSAHAFLQRTQPVSGTVIAASVGEVRLTFNERVEVRADKIAVTDGNGRRVDRRDAKVAPDDPLAVVVSLPQLFAGVYTVRYALVSSDTHPLSGEFRFGVDVAPADLLAGGTAAQSTAIDPPLIVQAIGRGLNLLGLILLIGPIVFRFFVLSLPWSRERVAQDEAGLRFDQRSVRIAWIAVAILIVGQVVALLSGSLASTPGDPGEAFQPANLLGTLTGRFGTLWLGRLALLLVPSLALPVIGAELALRAAEADAEEPADVPPGARTDEQRGWWAILLAGVSSALLTSIGGRAAVTAPIPLSIAVDWLHLLASCAWIGGLLALGLLGPALIRSLGQSAGIAALRLIVPRFSALALICIQVLVITGFYQTWVHVDGPTTITQSPYGLALLTKLLLIVPLLVLGAINRFVIMPRLRAAPDDGGEATQGTTSRRLWRTLWGEAALGVVVLAVVGLLTALPPARAVASANEGGTTTAAAPAAENVTVAAAAGTTLVDLTIGPTGNGPAVLSVLLRDPAGAAISDATVTLRMTPPDGSAVREVALVGRGGRYTGLGELGKIGAWRIEAVVTPSGGATERATFALDLPTGGARSLLARSDSAMNRLIGLSERQAINSGGPVVTTYYQWAAPDRLRLRSDVGSETIIIGKRRYDRATGAWIASDWADPAGYRWPIYEYARTASEVTLLGRETVDGVPCWVIGFLDTPSGGRMTMWIGMDDGLIRRQRMFAVGHYMESVFSDFNMPPTIEAP